MQISFDLKIENNAQICSNCSTLFFYPFFSKSALLCKNMHKFVKVWIPKGHKKSPKKVSLLKGKFIAKFT
jgi:hypothetical protein